jgi:hypothetical protein
VRRPLEAEVQLNRAFRGRHNGTLMYAATLGTVGPNITNYRAFKVINT